MNAGHRGDEAAAPDSDSIELSHDFRFQIPGQYKHVVWLVAHECVGRYDGNVASGQQLGLLVRVAVCDHRNVGCGDAAEVEQRIALSRRTVSGHNLAGSFSTR